MRGEDSLIVFVLMNESVFVVPPAKDFLIPPSGFTLFKSGHPAI
jgi:hypothetical protein